MKAWILMMGLALSLGAAPKSVGYLRVSQSTPIYHGASDSSKVEATARPGQVYELVDLDLIHGFYKIDHQGHVSYISAGAVYRLNDKGSPVPTVKPTLTKHDDRHDDDRHDDDDKKRSPTAGPTPRHDDDRHDDDDKKRSPTAGPTPAASPRPTAHFTAQATVEPGEEPTPRATPRPTLAPTERPTLAPSPRPTAVVTVEPTEGPTPRATARPTQEPTERPTLAPSPRPTAVVTVEPTEAPTQRATAVPTKAPTEVPTQRPTAVPTRVPTTAPTARPTLAPIPAPTEVAPDPAPGKRRKTPVPSGGTRTGSSHVWTQSALSLGGSVAHTVQLNRKPGHLNSLELVLPIGLGKHEAIVQPPYRQNSGVPEQRAIDFAGFVGLGLEARLAPPLRLHFDWIAHSHRTKAADLGKAALKVNVPGASPSTVFDESDAWYRMNTHQLRAGLKLSLPHPVVEPWINGTYGAWIWNAELSDLHREITYGDESGLAFGGTLGAGIDFHGSFAGGLGWTLTPFVEWGAPEVNPKLKDIAGLGVEWRDNHGTPVAIPARAGIQFGIGY